MARLSLWREDVHAVKLSCQVSAGLAGFRRYTATSIMGGNFMSVMIITESIFDIPAAQQRKPQLVDGGDKKWLR